MEATMQSPFTEFHDPDTAEELVQRVISDPEEARWRSGRALSRSTHPDVRGHAVRLLNSYLKDPESDIEIRTAYRITLALRLLQRPLPPDDVEITRGYGARFRPESTEAFSYANEEEFPVIDVHVHPKEPDGTLLTELLYAGIRHAVILATDTDPVDLEREEIRDMIYANYTRSDVADYMNFDEVLQQIGDSLYSPGHVTNQDIADWIDDYPGQLTGFGSVDLCRDPAYVEKTLTWLSQRPFRGIKLLPFSQFFNPETNENMDLLMSWCRRQHWTILTHSGCAPGVFEDPLMNPDSKPSLWAGAASRYPDVPIILAHFGAYGRKHRGYWFEDALDTMRKHENIWADTAAVWGMMSEEDVIKKIRTSVGFDRVLFGSDYPVSRVMPGKTAGVVRYYLANVLLTDDEKRKILYDNAAALLNLK